MKGAVSKTWVVSFGYIFCRGWCYRREQLVTRNRADSSWLKQRKTTVRWQHGHREHAQELRWPTRGLGPVRKPAIQTLWLSRFLSFYGVFSPFAILLSSPALLTPQTGPLQSQPSVTSFSQLSNGDWLKWLGISSRFPGEQSSRLSRTWCGLPQPRWSSGSYKVALRKL